MKYRLNLIKLGFHSLVLYQTEHIEAIMFGGSGSWFKQPPPVEGSPSLALSFANASISFDSVQARCLPTDLPRQSNLNVGKRGNRNCCEG